jgi:hypothetical protein
LKSALELFGSGAGFFMSHGFCGHRLVRRTPCVSLDRAATRD